MSTIAADSFAVPGPGAPAPDRPIKAATLANAWRTFLVRRVVGILVNLALLVLVTFLIVQLIPGDPATAIAGENASLDQVELVRTQLGLDQPLPVQLWTYLSGVVQGDFGDSYRYRQPAMDVVMTAVPYTLTITIAAVLLLLVLGIALGMASPPGATVGAGWISRSASSRASSRRFPPMCSPPASSWCSRCFGECCRLPTLRPTTSGPRPSCRSRRSRSAASARSLESCVGRRR
jgi:hypothetical protein